MFPAFVITLREGLEAFLIVAISLAYLRKSGRHALIPAVHLAVFVVQLLIYGFHEMTEANIFPYSEPLHLATEPYGPDGRYGIWLSYLLVLLPMGWLVFAGLFGGKKQAPSQ